MGKEARGNYNCYPHLVFLFIFLNICDLSCFFFAAVRETKRLESEHASKRNSVIASEYRLSHVSISKLLRRGHPSPVRIGRPQVFQFILVR